jgi:hypothetical protein
MGAKPRHLNKYHVVDFLSWKSLGHLAFEFPIKKIPPLVDNRCPNQLSF